jgi:hypothetical protein
VDRMSHLCGLVREDQNVYFNPDWMFRESLALLKCPKLGSLKLLDGKPTSGIVTTSKDWVVHPVEHFKAEDELLRLSYLKGLMDRSVPSESRWLLRSGGK